ncbi:MAG TPA: hypothetical protein VFE42_16735 [Chloroflexota bacterium]|nr:hypothetical protein [Chloroflexota bacterium]
MHLTVLYYYDAEAHNWFFRVPALRIIGGGQKAREEVERAAMDAIAFALDPETQIAGEELDFVFRRDYPVTMHQMSQEYAGQAVGG